MPLCLQEYVFTFSYPNSSVCMDVVEQHSRSGSHRLTTSGTTSVSARG